MDIFNAPTRESCLVRREPTNTPLQALAAMSDPQFVEAARRLAECALRESSSFDRRLDLITRHILARNMREPERRPLRAANDRLLAHYMKSREAAKAVISIGDSPPDRTLPVSELAVWTILVSTIFNLDEALNK